MCGTTHASANQKSWMFLYEDTIFSSAFFDTVVSLGRLISSMQISKQLGQPYWPVYPSFEIYIVMIESWLASPV